MGVGVCVGGCVGGYGNGNCVDKLSGYTSDCDEGYELMLQGNDTVRVVKESFLSLSSMVQWSFGDAGVVTCLSGYTLLGAEKCGAEQILFPWGLFHCVRHEVAGFFLKCRGHWFCRRLCERARRRLERHLNEDSITR